MTDVDTLRAAASNLRERTDGLPATLNTTIAAILDQWARIGTWDPDQLHRIAGPETIALARAITGDTAAEPEDAQQAAAVCHCGHNKQSHTPRGDLMICVACSAADICTAYRPSLHRGSH